MTLRAREGRVEVTRGKAKQARAANPLEVLRELLHQHSVAQVPDLPPFTAGAVGYFAYDFVRQLEPIASSARDDLKLPDCCLLFFDHVLVFDHVRHQIQIVSAADVRGSKSNRDLERIYSRARRAIGRLEKKLAAGLRQRRLRPGKATRRALKVRSQVPRERFIRDVERAKDYIAAGDVFQVVLSERLDFEPKVSAFEIYRALRAINPSPYMYFLRMNDVEVLGSSPEMLVRVSGDKLDYRPIAGTRPRGQDEQADLQLEDELRHDEKERANT